MRNCDWEQRKLGEVSTLSSSKRIHLSDYVQSGVPFYRGSEISNGGVSGRSELFISETLYLEIKEKYGVPVEGDLLITAVGTLGNVWKVDNSTFYYKDGNLIRLSDLHGDSDYLYSYFSDNPGKKKLLDSAAGSNQKALTMVKMREITIPLPSLEEQIKIGTFFKQLDSTIALHQRKLDLLEQLKQTFLQVMFPQGEQKNPLFRFAGFSEPWEQRKVGEFLKESRIPGTDGSVAKKLTVKLWRKGVIPKEESYQGSPATNYFIRKSGQFIYGKLDFLNQAFGIVPDHLDGYESTLDSPAFDIFPIMNSIFFLEYVSRKEFYLYQ